MFYHEEKKALVPNDFEPKYEKLLYFLYIFQKFESYNNYMAVISVSGRPNRVHRALANIWLVQRDFLVHPGCSWDAVAVDWLLSEKGGA